MAGGPTNSIVIRRDTPTGARQRSQLPGTEGGEFGAGPTVVVVDTSVARNLATTTLKSDARASITDQQGLKLSLSIEGTKSSRIERMASTPIWPVRLRA
jgi:hypothetical protein